MANLLHAVNKFTLRPEFKEYYIRAIQNLLKIADNHSTSSLEVELEAGLGQVYQAIYKDLGRNVSLAEKA